MDVIKLQNFKGSDDCYFLDAGDITIEPIEECYAVLVKNKDGLPLFRSGMNIAYVPAFGSISGNILDRESFVLPPRQRMENILKEEVFCFDPRVVTFAIFVPVFRHKVFKDGKKIKNITVPMLSTEESKEFLRKNNLLREDPDTVWNPGDLPDEMIGIPEKVRNLLN